MGRADSSLPIGFGATGEPAGIAGSDLISSEEYSGGKSNLNLLPGPGSLSISMDPPE
jgi:hypothetical protein